MTVEEREKALLNEIELLEISEEHALSISDDVHLETISLRRKDIQSELDTIARKEE